MNMIRKSGSTCRFTFETADSSGSSAEGEADVTVASRDTLSDDSLLFWPYVSNQVFTLNFLHELLMKKGFTNASYGVKAWQSISFLRP